MLWLRLLLPFFFCVSMGCGCGCSLRFVVRLLLPCLLRFSGCGSSPFLFYASRHFSFFFVSGLSQVSSLFHHFGSSGCMFSLYVPSSSSFVRGFLRSGFGASSAGVTFFFLSVPTAFCGDSASFRSPVPFATWSPFGTSQVLLRPLFLSLVRVASGGLFHFLVGFRSVPPTHSHLRFP